MNEEQEDKNEEQTMLRLGLSGQKRGQNEKDGEGASKKAKKGWKLKKKFYEKFGKIGEKSWKLKKLWYKNVILKHLY